jgi:hypothetical protein
MAALAANSPVLANPVDGNLSLKGATSTTYYAGSIIALNRQTGLATKWVDASNAGNVFQGICPQKLVSDSSGNNITRATQVTGVVPLEVPLYPIFNRLAASAVVAGVTAVTNHGAPVFCLTDNAAADLTITSPADDRAPVGIVWRFRSTGVADVLYFTPMEAILYTMIGVFNETVMGFAVAGFSTGTTYGKVMQGISGAITNVVLRAGAAAATGSSTSTIQVNVNAGDNLFATADVVALAEGEVFVTDEAVVTTGNRHIFHDGDTVNIVIADGGTPMTALTAIIEARYQRLIGV